VTQLRPESYLSVLADAEAAAGGGIMFPGVGAELPVVALQRGDVQPGAADVRCGTAILTWDVARPRTGGPDVAGIDQASVDEQDAAIAEPLLQPAVEELADRGLAHDRLADAVRQSRRRRSADSKQRLRTAEGTPASGI
jgi:hypothetical protein